MTTFMQLKRNKVWGQLNKVVDSVYVFVVFLFAFFSMREKKEFQCIFNFALSLIFIYAWMNTILFSIAMRTTKKRRKPSKHHCYSTAFFSSYFCLFNCVDITVGDLLLYQGNKRRRRRRKNGFQKNPRKYPSNEIAT